MQQTAKPHAIVVGLDSMTGLQTARILSRRGVPVIAIARNPAHPCCRTNVCERIVVADTTSEEFVEALVALGQELEQKAEEILRMDRPKMCEKKMIGSFGELIAMLASK